MNSKQTNKLASYTATVAVLKANPEVDNVPGLPAKVATLSARTGEINSLAKTQTQTLKSSTADRNQLLEAMVRKSLEIAGFLTTVAREQKLAGLAQTANVARTTFQRLRLNHRVWLAQRILDAAQTVVPQLAAYGVTAETLADQQARIDAATAGLDLTRVMMTTKKAATEKLAELFDDVDGLLEDEIDRLVAPLRDIDSEFHAAYRAARSIIDRPGGRPAANGETSAPVPVTASAPTTTPPPTAVEKQAA